MVIKYGMYEEIGTLNLLPDEYSVYKLYSEKTAEKIDYLVKILVDKQFNIAKDIIQSNFDQITILAQVLNKKEYITKEEFEQLMVLHNNIP
jgi:cell division protease FtsH